MTFDDLLNGILNEHKLSIVRRKAIAHYLSHVDFLKSTSNNKIIISAHNIDTLYYNTHINILFYLQYMSTYFYKSSFQSFDELYKDDYLESGTWDVISVRGILNVIINELRNYLF